MKRLTLILVPFFCWGAEDEMSYRSTKSMSFNYLEYTEDSLLSTHSIRLSLKIPAGFRPVAPSNHSLIFNNHPFNVSVAALIGKDSVIMVHAEKAADDSGVLDYSSLPFGLISGIKFHTRSDCIEPSDALMEGHHDFRYLSENGFESRPGMYLKQFMHNTKDLKSEYIVSYAKRVDGCSEEFINEQFKRDFDEQMQLLVTLSEA